MSNDSTAASMSFDASSGSDSDDMTLPPLANNSSAVTPGVGLSNPEVSRGRRQMLDLVNRLQSTG
jgi:hypothetical protein